jgi:hypothetical protein
MRPMPPSPSTVDVARETLDMSKHTSGDRAFRLMAIAMMVVTAVATGAHALHSVYRDIRGRREAREYDQSRRRPYSLQEEPAYRSAERESAPSWRSETEQDRNWSRREELRGRGPQADERWTEYRPQQSNGRDR